MTHPPWWTPPDPVDEARRRVAAKRRRRSELAEARGYGLRLRHRAKLARIHRKEHDPMTASYARQVAEAILDAAPDTQAVRRHAVAYVHANCWADHHCATDADLASLVVELVNAMQARPATIATDEANT